MKTKFYALLASVALIVPAQAGGFHGGGGGGGHFAGGGGGGHFAGGGGNRFGGGGHFSAVSRGGAVGSFRSMPTRSFSGSRIGMNSGQRFSQAGIRSPNSGAFRQQFSNANRNATIGKQQLGNNPRFAQSNNASARRNGNIANHQNRAGQVRNGNNLPSNWRNHVFGQRSANWQRGWDRNRDHFWHGHRCHFFNGSWVIFDTGFYPWWPYWYPEDYYYGDAYDQGDYYPVYQGEPYSNQNSYEPADQYAGITVSAAQRALAGQGYYRGAIDGVPGAGTRQAIARYQADHGLRSTGYLTSETVQSLGIRQVNS